MTKKSIKKKRFNEYQIIKVFSACIIIWFVGSAAINMIKTTFVHTMTIGKQVQEEQWECFGALDLEEYVLMAPASGPVVRQIAEGKKVGKNDGVFQVGGQTVYASEAGLVSYQLDGLESFALLEEYSIMDFKTKYEEQKQLFSEKEAVEEAVSGSGYAKVINNFDNVYLCLASTPNSYISSLEEDERIQIRFLDMDYEQYGRVKEIRQVPGSDLVYLRLDLGCPDQHLMQQRFYKIALPYNREYVIEIPQKALVSQGDKNGVYFLQKGFVFWQEIAIVKENTDTVEVEGLEEGTIIVTTPQLVKEGENIKF